MACAKGKKGQKEENLKITINISRIHVLSYFLLVIIVVVVVTLSLVMEFSNEVLVFPKKKKLH